MYIVSRPYVLDFHLLVYMRNLNLKDIDNLLTLNNAAVIYRHELQLKRTTECETKLSYNILVTIENGKYLRDNFIVNVPYLSPSGPAYVAAIICSNYSMRQPRFELFGNLQRSMHKFWIDMYGVPSVSKVPLSSFINVGSM